MKLINKFAIVAAISALTLVNCHKKAEGNPAGGLIMASIVNSAATGNCAISINHSGIYYGAIVSMAVQNGGSATGVYTNAAINTTSVTTFGQTQFEKAGGKTISELGYASYAAVPYNLKYDAFFTNSADGSTWTADLRNKALAYTKTFYDYFSFVGFLVLASQDTANASTHNTSASSAFPTGTGATAVSLVASNGASATACNTLAGYGTTCSAATTNLAASFGLTNLANGTASLACAKIPRSSCSFGALTTDKRETDITNTTAALSKALTTNDCVQPSSNFPEALKRYMFKGLPAQEYPPTTGQTSTSKGSVSVEIKGYLANTRTNSAASSIDSSTGILPYYAYPKFGSLVSLGFGTLMPVASGTTAYPTEGSATVIPYYGGSNINVTTVESCEGLGLTAGPLVDLAQGTSTVRKKLTPAYEVAYAFSVNGQAASAYARARAQGPLGIDQSVGSDTNLLLLPTDLNSANSIACNNALRASYAVSSLLGVTKMPIVDGASGDGGATQLLSICVYGGTDTKRKGAKQILASGLNTANGINTITISQVPTCGEGSLATQKAALSAASQAFGDAGLKTLASYPNGE